MAEIGQDIKKAASLLCIEDVVSIPTETVYGLAGNAFSEKAILKIFEVKNRPLTDPLIVHVAGIEAILPLVVELPALAKQLFEAFSPGPLTILLPKSNAISNLVTNGSQFVAIRIPNHPLTLKLLQVLDFPLVAPSANPFGGLSPSLAEHVEKGLGNKISYILDGGPCNVGLESTIVQIIDNDRIKILRQGGISEEELLTFAALAQPKNDGKEVVPGSMLSHYAPQKRLLIQPVSEVLKKYKSDEIAFLGFDQYSELLSKEKQILLSATGNMKEAAQTLFSALHVLDSLQVKVIVAAQIPEKGLGKAISDRLKRAAAKL